MIRNFFIRIGRAIFWVYSLLRYLSYKRVASCFVLALSFCSTVIIALAILNNCMVGIPFKVLSGLHDYKVSNPITIVSLCATFVTISLTLLGFALNSFAKKEIIKGSNDNNRGNGVNASPLEEAANILLVRYRGIGQSLLFLNVLCFPLLAKAFTLIIFLFAMVVQCFIGEFRLFYLLVYAALMAVIILSILISVFQIYSDVNYSMFCACKIIVKKMGNKIRYLSRTNSLNWDSTGLVGTMRKYIATDIYRGILLLQDANSKILYTPFLTRKALVIKNMKKRHFLIEMAVISGLNNEAMYGNKMINEADRKDSFLQYFKYFVKYENGIINAFEEELNFIKNTKELTYLANKDNIDTSLRWFYDRIKSEEKENGKSE